MTLIDPKASRELALRARLDGGEAVSLSQTTWDVAGFCQNPRQHTVEARQYRGDRYSPEFGAWASPKPNGYVLNESAGRAHAVYLTVRCGKCWWCLNARRRLWTDRAVVETGKAARTWFVTLTANPETQLRWTGQAYRRLEDGGTKPASLDEGEWYQERCKEAGRELTLYVKRLRKQAKASLRALWVFERHEGGGAHDGLPHVHGLLHESEEGAVNYRILKSQWLCGYIHAKLLTDEAESVGSYVAKCCGYLSKSTNVRIRASRGYGLLVANQAPLGIGPKDRENEMKKKGLSPKDVDLNASYKIVDAVTALSTETGEVSVDQPRGLNPLSSRYALESKGS